MNHLIKSYALVLAIQLAMLPQSATAQNEVFIYGTVYTEDGDEYTGPLRWGKEEVYWTDMFNASKLENENINYLSRDEIQDIRSNRNVENRMTSWVSNKWTNYGWDWDNEFVHQFSCPFGYIKSITMHRRDKVIVELQDGSEFEVDGDGYNDIGTKIRILDDEIGQIELSWSRIERIEFSETPKKLDNTFGEPLYGEVESDQGIFTGLVQWDHDERLSEDELDGDTYDGDLSIAFGKIRSIENEGSSSFVTLKSGRELNLRGSNDVNSSNRGIIVSVEGLGRVDIPWREFEKVTFKDMPKTMKKYSDFNKTSPITGTVITSNGSYEGKLVFDLDEAFDFESLNGMQDRTEFIIPFANLQRISPKGYRYATVTLKNGDKLTLDDSQDVSDKNTGVLVFEGKEARYLSWQDIDSIEFD